MKVAFKSTIPNLPERPPGPQFISHRPALSAWGRWLEEVKFWREEVFFYCQMLEMNKAAFDGDAKRARGVLVNAFIVYQNETLPLLESSLQKAVAGGYTVEGAHHRHDMMEDLEKHERQLKRLKLAAFPLLKEAQPVVFW